MLARVEQFFWAAGSVGLLYTLFLYCEAQTYQNLSVHSEEPMRITAPSNPSLMGRLDIPELALSVPILSGYDPDSLRKGVGHIPGTAMPGGLGTVGLAGHRDTFLRPLRRLTIHMEIRLIGPSGTYRYRVDSTEIVTPDRVDVLAINNQPELTLITCYPFDYIGSAPKRFIVHAHLLSTSPEPPTLGATKESHEASIQQDHYRLLP